MRNALSPNVSLNLLCSSNIIWSQFHLDRSVFNWSKIVLQKNIHFEKEEFIQFFHSINRIIYSIATGSFDDILKVIFEKLKIDRIVGIASIVHCKSEYTSWFTNWKSVSKYIFNCSMVFSFKRNRHWTNLSHEIYFISKFIRGNCNENKIERLVSFISDVILCVKSPPQRKTVSMKRRV